MGRSESKQISQESEQNAQQNQGNAQTALSGTNKSLGDYKSSLDSFMNFGRSTYGANGEYMKDENTLANTTAAAGATNLKGNLAMNAARTGENTAGYADTAAESQRQGERDLTSQLATSDASRLDKLTAINQYGVQASALPSQVQSGLYGTSLGGSNSAMGTAASAAAASPGFFDVFGQDVSQAAGAAIGAYAGCPCAGSVIQLASPERIPVERVMKGQSLLAMGWTRPPNHVVDHIVAVKQPCFEIVTLSGRRHKASASHTLALATGGYVCMKDALNETVLVVDKGGTDLVTEVTDIGEQLVYPMPIDGSHCYLADGFWILS